VPTLASASACPALPQVTQHGACLGLGIAALGTEDEEAFEDVKNVLYMDNAGGYPAFYIAFIVLLSLLNLYH
jgi:hypothetical protein